MAALVHSNPSDRSDSQALLPRGDDALGLLAAGLALPVRMLRLWWLRHAGRQALLSLDDRLLADVGLTRGDALTEWQKAFWER